MRNGLLAAVVFLLLAGAGPASAQAFYPYYYGGYPAAYGGYPAAYGGYRAPYYAPSWGYYGYTYLPPYPPVMAPPPQWAYPRPACAPPVPPSPGPCWPPPCQELPSSTAPPPDVVPGDACNPSNCAPMDDLAPGNPLLCNRPAPPPPPPAAPACGPDGYRWYGAADLLYLWMKPGSLPPLAATGPLGAPGTAVLLGGPTFDDQQRLGARVTLGRWLGDSQRVGVEASYLQLFQRDMGFVADSVDGHPLAVPFFNTATGAEDAVLFAAPGTQTGRITVEEYSRLWSAETNVRVELGRSCWYHVDLLGGFRAVGFDEGLGQTDTTQRWDGSGSAVSDRFDTRNLFLGAQVGAGAEFAWGRWFGDIWGKIALGDNHEAVSANGTTLLTSITGAQTALPGGIFTGPGTSGSYSRDELTFVPQAGLHVGYQMAHHTRLFAGYEFLYLANVARPGDQIDRSVSPGPSAGAAFAIRDTDVWVQGVSMGLEFRY